MFKSDFTVDYGLLYTLPYTKCVKWFKLQYNTLNDCYAPEGRHIKIAPSASPSVSPSVRVTCTVVSLKTLKLYGLESSNLRGMLLGICSCAPGVSFAAVHSKGRVMTLDLAKIYHCTPFSNLQTCVAQNFKTVWPSVIKP